MYETMFGKFDFKLFEHNLTKNEIKLLMYLRIRTQGGKYKKMYIAGIEISEAIKMNQGVIVTTRKSLIKKEFIKFENKRYTTLETPNVKNEEIIIKQVTKERYELMEKFIKEIDKLEGNAKNEKKIIFTYEFPNFTYEEAKEMKNIEIIDN